MDLVEIGWSGMELTDLIKDRNQCRAFVKTGMNLRVPYYSGNFLSGSTTAALC
jgi:hypothetical protein